MEASLNQFTEPMPAKRRVNHAQAGIEAIDRGLAEAEAITIVDALNYHVEQGKMTHEEAILCLAAVNRVHVRFP